MFRNVLVAIDGSPHADTALGQAIDLAQVSNAQLTILTCMPDPSGWLLAGGAYGGALNFEALAEESRAEYESLLNQAVARVPSDLPVTKVLAHGRPAERILEQVGSGGHDLVLMGSRGRGDVRSLLLGSVSHHVLNSSHAAVLIVRASPEELDT